MPTLESSLLYTREDGSQDFVHDKYRDFFLAKYFADRINDGRLSVEDAYRKYWSYEEDAELWGLPKDKEWRGLLPLWKSTLTYAAGMLNDAKAKELVDIVSRSFLQSKDIIGADYYNPFNDDLLFSATIIGASTHTRLGENKTTQEIVMQMSRLAPFKELWAIWQEGKRLSNSLLQSHTSEAREYLLDTILFFRGDGRFRGEIWDIAQTYHEEIKGPLLEYLDEKKIKDVKNFRQYIITLGKCGYKEAASVLLEMFKKMADQKSDGTANYDKECIIKALGLLQYREAMPYIMPYAKMENPFSYQAVKALYDIDPKFTIELMSESLERGNKEQRIYFLGRLGDLKTRRVIPYLVKYLGDQEFDVMIAVCDSLRTLEVEEGCLAVFSLLRNIDMAQFRGDQKEALNHQLYWNAAHIQRLKLGSMLTSILEGDYWLENKKMAAELLKTYKVSETLNRLSMLMYSGDKTTSRIAAETWAKIKGVTDGYNIEKLGVRNFGRIVESGLTAGLCPDIEALVEESSVVLRREAVKFLIDLLHPKDIPKEVMKFLEDSLSRTDYFQSAPWDHLIYYGPKNDQISELVLNSMKCGGIRVSLALSYFEDVEYLPAASVIHQLMRKFYQEPDSIPNSRYELERTINILGQMRYQTAIPDIKRVYEEEDSTLKNKAAFALMRMGELSPVQIEEERFLGNLEVYILQEPQLESEIDKNGLEQLLHLDIDNEKTRLFFNQFIRNVHESLKPKRYNPPVKKLGA